MKQTTLSHNSVVHIYSTNQQKLSEWKRSICISFTWKYSWRNLQTTNALPLNKGTIYHNHVMYVQPFTTIVGWQEIWRWMEVSMFYFCRYLVFTWFCRFSRLIDGVTISLKEEETFLYTGPMYQESKSWLNHCKLCRNVEFTKCRSRSHNNHL